MLDLDVYRIQKFSYLSLSLSLSDLELDRTLLTTFQITTLSRSKKSFPPRDIFSLLQLTAELHLPEVADLNDGPGRGAVPGVLVDEEEDDLLQTHRHLAENLAHVVRQLK